ncbi:MAG: hypothetical protein CMC55_07070 [Flavobacteriaceae bacterium]|nr:hypothetical protein [Flavobacteriaceae bacterium]|tara:strand:+ start:898 stop:1149 length:252 start_codon:yes stop_codon:yes gene_type:complete
MTKFKCKCGKTKELSKTTIVLINKEWVTKEALCKCGKYMKSKPKEGMPSLIRTEETLSKKGDKLWAGAKEKLCGERGINEPFD